MGLILQIKLLFFAILFASLLLTAYRMVKDARRHLLRESARLDLDIKRIRFASLGYARLLTAGNTVQFYVTFRVTAHLSNGLRKRGYARVYPNTYPITAIHIAWDAQPRTT